MLNIPEYRNYSGETKIALMDNSTVAFLEQGGYLQRNYLLDMRLYLFLIGFQMNYVIRYIEKILLRA